MQKISPFLWFDKNAEDAATFYTSLIPNSSVGTITRYGKEGYDVHHMPEGTVMTVQFTMAGFVFNALNGGADFKPNPSISFHIKCKTAEEVDEIWKKLLPEGKVLMELGSYPFSKRYGWIQDKYGFSWQIIHTTQPFTQTITPVLMYTRTNVGRAEEAVNLYTSVFSSAPNVAGKSAVNTISRYGKGMEPNKENSVMYASFFLENTEFGAMDSAGPHEFTFNEAISLEVTCADQKEVDYFWTKLTENGGQESVCGWLKDKFGISWQITPTRLNTLLSDPDKTKAGQVMNAMLTMKKIDVAKLEEAYANA